ncbi:ankyrin repeat domain-containing protein [Kribbella sp. NBC_00889]|uniref:ankyrin repeat domain-containing protein n=1 Tax=Kribbella sp. NBC_00889 TaxID=2975974 RepID=UPI003863CC82
MSRPTSCHGSLPRAADVRAGEPDGRHTVGVAPNDPDRLGRTSLHYAAVDGPVDQVRNLLASGANVAATDRQGFTPLQGGPATPSGQTAQRFWRDSPVAASGGRLRQQPLALYVIRESPSPCNSTDPDWNLASRGPSGSRNGVG